MRGEGRHPLLAHIGGSGVDRGGIWEGCDSRGHVEQSWLGEGDPRALCLLVVTLNDLGGIKKEQILMGPQAVDVCGRKYQKPGAGAVTEQNIPD